MINPVELPKTFQVDIGAIEIATVSATAEGATNNALYWLAENVGSRLLKPFLNEMSKVEGAAVLHNPEVTARLHSQHATSGLTRLHGIAEKLDPPKPMAKEYRSLTPLTDS